MAACTICARPNVAAINAALLAGEGLGTIGKRHGLPKTTLQRHRSKCSLAGTAGPPEDPAKPGGNPAGTVPRQSRRRDPCDPSPSQVREGRVRVIMDLMASQRWEADDGERFAAEWGIGLTAVRDYAGEAGRRLLAMEDPAWGKRLLAAMDELVDVAMASARTGDPKAISAAAQVFRVWIDRGKAAPVEKTTEAPVFKIDLSLPVRPPEGESGEG